MATLSFEGETHAEIVQKVRRWLGSVDGDHREAALDPTDIVRQGAELTKDALRVIAEAAPAPVAQSDLVKTLTGLGYKATDATRDAVIDSLDAVSEMTGGSVVSKVGEAGRSAVFQMSEAMARQILKGITKG